MTIFSCLSLELSITIAHSCFEKGCLTNGEKLTQQRRKLLWVMVVFTVARLNLKVFQRDIEKETAQTRIRSFSFLVAESP